MALTAGPATVLIVSPITRPTSVIRAASKSQGLVSTSPFKAPNFNFTCPSVSTSTACDFSYVVSFRPLIPIASAYFKEASSSLSIIPSSSNSSGSCLIIPLVIRSRASPILRPRAWPESLAASPIARIDSLPKPAAVANIVDCAACL